MLSGQGLRMGQRRGLRLDVSRLELDIPGNPPAPARPALPTGDGRIRTCDLWALDNPELPARRRARDRPGCSSQRSASELRRHERRRESNPRIRASSALSAGRRGLPDCPAFYLLNYVAKGLNVGDRLDLNPQSAEPQSAVLPIAPLSPRIMLWDDGGTRTRNLPVSSGNLRQSARRQASCGEGVVLCR